MKTRRVSIPEWSLEAKSALDTQIVVGGCTTVSVDTSHSLRMQA